MPGIRLPGRASTWATASCRGATLPGCPGVTMGQNNDVAWTFTNVMADVMDLFIERIDGDEYEFDGERRPLEVDRRGDRRQGPVARAPRRSA